MARSTRLFCHIVDPASAYILSYTTTDTGEYYSTSMYKTRVAAGMKFRVVLPRYIVLVILRISTVLFLDKQS